VKIVEVWTFQTVRNVKNFTYGIWTRNGWVCFLLKPAGYLRDKRGIFKMGRGLGGILAGYVNCWRPNLPLSQLCQNYRYEMSIIAFQPGFFTENIQAKDLF
jgi:hypothetical protein